MLCSYNKLQLSNYSLGTQEQHLHFNKCQFKSTHNQYFSFSHQSSRENMCEFVPQFKPNVCINILSTFIVADIVILGTNQVCCSRYSCYTDSYTNLIHIIRIHRLPIVFRNRNINSDSYSYSIHIHMVFR